MASPAGKGAHSNDERLEYRTNLVVDDPRPTFVEDDLRLVEPPRELGVLGRSFKVHSCDPSERFAY